VRTLLSEERKRFYLVAVLRLNLTPAPKCSRSVATNMSINLARWMSLARMPRQYDVGYTSHLERDQARGHAHTHTHTTYSLSDSPIHTHTFPCEIHTNILALLCYCYIYIPSINYQPTVDKCSFSVFLNTLVLQLLVTYAHEVT
jgi:hypothetical protein